MIVTNADTPREACDRDSEIQFLRSEDFRLGWVDGCTDFAEALQ